MSETDSRPSVRFGVFQFEPATGDLWKAGRVTRLQDQPRQVLAMLLSRPGELISRDQLRAALWQDDTFVDFDTGLNVVVNKIRHALGDSATSPRFIETLPRRGYRFIAPVLGVEEQRRTVVRRHARWLGPLSLLIVLTLATAVWWAWSHWPVGPRPVPGPVRSLAVMPLDNLSGHAAEDYLVDGIADALVTDLASIRALRVISRQSTRRYKGSTKPTTTIAAELNVDAVIQGSVLRSGNRIRLNVQLIDGRSDRHLWAQAYEHDLRDIQRLHRDTVEAVAREIRVALTPGERSRLSRVRPVNPESHDAYLRGRYRLTGFSESEPETARALAEFERAVKLDPTNAAAYVGIAEAHQVRGTFLGGHPPLEERRMAFAAARRALDLDPDLGEAYAITGRVQLSEFDWAGAEQSFAKMLELSPGHSPGLLWYAYQQLLQGRTEEAVDTAKQAEAITPLDLNTRVRTGFVHRFALQPHEAIKRYQEVLALDSNNSMALRFLADEYHHVGKHEQALATATEALARHGRTAFGLSRLAASYGLTGRRDDALGIVAELGSLAQRQYVSPAHFVVAYEGLGDRDRTFAWLEKAYDERSNYVMYVPLDTWFSWRDDPRYSTLVRKIRQQHSVRGGS